MLIKHGKNIIGERQRVGGVGMVRSLDWSQQPFCPVVDEQFVLKRVADCAIDLYAMVVVLSRYTSFTYRRGARCFAPEPDVSVQSLTFPDRRQRLGPAREDPV